MGAINPGIGVLWMWMSKPKSLLASSNSHNYGNYLRFLAKPNPISLLLELQQNVLILGGVKCVLQNSICLKALSQSQI